MSLSWGLFCWAVIFPREDFSRLLSGGWKTGCQLSRCLEGEGWRGWFLAFILYMVTWCTVFTLVSCLHLCLCPWVQIPCVLLAPENTLPVICYYKDRQWGGYLGSECLLGRLSTSFPYLLFSLPFYFHKIPISVGSAFVDSINCGPKIFRKKIPESSKKQNLNLLCTCNYLHSIYIVLGIISNPEIT